MSEETLEPIEAPPITDTAAIRRFHKELKDAKVILMNKPDVEFFGTLAYGLNVYALDSVQYIKNSGGIPSVAYTDGESITFLIDNTITKEEMIFIFVHELLHIICQHPKRRGNRNPILWNMAVDHVVNRVCLELSRTKNYIKPIKGGCIFFEDIHQDDNDILPETLYELLCKKSQLSENEKESVFKIGTGNGTPNPNKSTQVYGRGDKSSPAYKVETEELVDKDGKPLNKVKVTVTNLQGGEKNTAVYDRDQEDPTKMDKIEKACEEVSNDAKTLWYSTPSIAKGNMPGGMVEFLDSLFKVEIPWEDVMEDAVLYAVQNASRRSWTEPNIYIRHPRVPGKRTKRSPYYLIAAVDCSGSISTEDLRLFAGVLLGSAAYYKAIHVIVHDQVVQEEIVISRNLSETALIEKINKFIGRGGTSHVGPFERIKELVQEERVSTILFQTDYYSDVENIFGSYKWIKDYETIWVLNSNEEVKLNGCKTKVIRLPREHRRTSKWR
jgi:predicted metal-dependent peptidase